MRPLTFGYLRVSPSATDDDVARLKQAIADYAQREGFTLERVFVDRSQSHTAGFSALVDALQRDEARHVVIPALHHLARFPGMRHAMKQMLERQTGARVLVMYASGEDAG